MIATITKATDNILIGLEVDTDLKKPIELPNGEFLINGRAHLGSGAWRLWSNDEFIDIQEDSK